MKIRTGYVSNSSSSSFIICGNGVKQILMNSLNNQDTMCSDYWGDSTYYTVGEINKEILEQCEKSDNKMVKNVIDSILYRSISSYQDKIFWEKISKKECNMFWGMTPESKTYDLNIKGSFFDLSDEAKEVIEKSMMKIYKKTKSESHWDYYRMDSDELNAIIEKQVESIYNSMKESGKEVYAVSFGDNHGECTGALGWLVESEYLGNKEINLYLNSNFEIYQSDEH